MLASLAILLAVQAAQPQQAPPAEKPKLICREGEQELGSHIHTSRRCKTAEDWQQEDARRDQTPTTLRVVNSQGDGTQRPQRPPLP